MKHNVFCIINAIIPIIIGAILYYLVDSSVVFVKYIDSIFSGGYHVEYSNHNLLLIILRNHLFDALWSYSLMFSIYLIINMKSRLVWAICISAVLGIFLESIQLFERVPGTFDFMDILIQLFSVVLASIIICMNRRGINEEIS